MNFWNKDDPASQFESRLADAVDNGDVAAVQAIVDTDRDFAPAVYRKAFEKAVKNDQLRMAELIIRSKPTLPRPNMVLRDVVLKERTAMFRLLSEYMDFGSFAYNAIESGDSGYRNMLRFMQKDLQCTLLQEALEAVKEELLVKNKGEMPPALEKKLSRLKNDVNIEL